VAAIPASAALSGVAEFLEAGAAGGVFEAVGAILGVALQWLPIIATIGATILVYRIVPRPSPAWRATILPGITIGLVLTLVARVFAFLAPRLIGTAALIGTLATVFAALAWLALSFQAILVGAAWVREREDAIQAAAILSAANVRFQPATIGGWARAGKVQSIKLGGRRFVRRGEIKALIAPPRRVNAAHLQPGLFEDLGD
ncbi:MAG: YhjD/YihY/BrkB family envelope integrity protein, partial [Chloroflexota bacterium]